MSNIPQQTKNKLKNENFDSVLNSSWWVKSLALSIYLSIESHFVGVHGPYELHRKEEQIKCTALAVHENLLFFDAIHMAREHRQNAIQYLYLHLFTTKFVAVLLTLTQKSHISQVSNVQKVRHLEQPVRTDDELKKAAMLSSANNTNKKLIFLKFDYRKYSNILLLYKSTCHLLLKWT